MKLWDLRTFNEERCDPVFEFNTSFSVVSAKYFYTPSVSMRTKIIGFGTSDKKIVFLNFNGDKLSENTMSDPISAIT